MIPALLCVSAALCFSRVDNVTMCPNGTMAPTLQDALKMTEKLNDTSFSFMLREKYLNKSLRFVVDHDRRDDYNVFVMQHVKPKYTYCAMPQATPFAYLALLTIVCSSSIFVALLVVINCNRPGEQKKNDDNNNA